MGRWKVFWENTGYRISDLGLNFGCGKFFLSFGFSLVNGGGLERRCIGVLVLFLVDLRFLRYDFILGLRLSFELIWLGSKGSKLLCRV